MPIFMITPKQEEQKAEDVKVEDPKTEPSNPEEVKEEVPNVGEVDQSLIDKNTVLIDGPLSQIYTEELNRLYAKEDYVAELPVILALDKEDQEKEESLKENASYLYVADGEYFENDGYVDAFDTLVKATESYKHTFLCIEHNMNITSKVADMLSYARKNGVQIINDRASALEMLSLKLKK